MEQNEEYKKKLAKIHALESVLQSRANLADRLGLSYGGDRDLYKALGYTKTPTYDDFFAFYQRNGIAKRVVNAPVEASWRLKPTITESKKTQTKFEKEWLELVKKYNVWHYLARADRLAGIGCYGVLVLGFGDNADKPLSNKKAELLYIRPYTQDGATISKYVGSKKDPRYGLPEEYSLQTKQENVRQDTGDYKIHYSRVIHIAENVDSDDIMGTPRLLPILNNLMDLEKVAGGSAEMFWRGAFPGMALTADKDANMQTLDLDDLEDELQAYIHKLQRYIRLQGINIQELTPQVVNPAEHFNIIIQMISASSHIPKRILIGSERGELASSQDDINWNTHIAYRKTDYCEPIILRPFIDKMIEVGMLPEPSNEYIVEWPDSIISTEKDRAEIDRVRMDTLSKYVSAPGANFVIPREMFLDKYMGFTEDEIKQAEQLAKDEEDLSIENETEDMNEMSRENDDSKEDKKKMDKTDFNN